NIQIPGKFQGPIYQLSASRRRELGIGKFFLMLDVGISPQFCRQQRSPSSNELNSRTALPSLAEQGPCAALANCELPVSPPQEPCCGSRVRRSRQPAASLPAH